MKIKKRGYWVVQGLGEGSPVVGKKEEGNAGFFPGGSSCPTVVTPECERKRRDAIGSRVGGTGNYSVFTSPQKKQNE